jgi:hypothetical protein
MLRTNLATRPFYNDRLVRIVIATAIALVTALTAFNVLQVLSLNARNSEVTARTEDAERRTAEYRQQAQVIRQSLNTEQMTAMQNAAREANLLIGQRVFSWTELFNQFERTLPADVRIAAVEPQVDTAGRLLVAVTVISKTPEDLNEFMDQLESSGRFRDVLNRQDSAVDEGLMRSVIQGYYNSTPMPAGEAGPTSDSSVPGNTPPGRPANASPSTPEDRR